MIRANKNALCTPASLATDGEQGEGANAVGVGGGEHTRSSDVTLYDALALLGTAAEFLDASARATDEPGPGVPEAADLLDAVRAILARLVTP